MSHEAAEGLSRYIGGGTLKGVGISVIMGVLGFATKSLLQVNTQQQILEQHSQALATLSTSAQKTSDSVQALTITTARVEGKIDVLKQRIDDQRGEAHVARSTAVTGSSVR
jgi:Tfp pilus assembly protein PilN